MVLSARWSALTAGDLDRIHDSALQVLERVGVAVMDTDLREQLGAVRRDIFEPARQGTSLSVKLGVGPADLLVSQVGEEVGRDGRQHVLRFFRLVEDARQGRALGVGGFQMQVGIGCRIFFHPVFLLPVHSGKTFRFRFHCSQWACILTT